MTQESITNISKTYLSPVLGRYHQTEYAKGEGCYIWDTNGNKYLDFSSGIGVTSTGHCHPKIVKAICDQAQQFIHPCIGNGHYSSPALLAQTLSKLVENAQQKTVTMTDAKMNQMSHNLHSASLSFQNENMVHLSQKELPTSAMTDAKMNQIFHFESEPFTAFFAQSGSEANEAAIKLAKYVTKRKKLVAFQGGFHGRTLGSLSLTTSKMKYRDGYEPLLEGVSFFPYPYTYRCPWGKTTEEESTKAAIRALEESPLFNNEVAAVFIEPALGEAGYVPAPNAFLQALRTVCDKHGILLVFDEIQTGIGRTGTWFAFEHANVIPDIITLAKGIASGMPLSVCLAKKSIMDKWSPGAHGGTYGANPVTCAAANATLEVITEALPTIADKSQAAFKLLHEELGSYPTVGDIRGYGLFIGIEFVKDKQSKTPFPELIKPILEKAKEKGLILISCGLHDNVIRIIPPLIIEKSTLLDGLKIICDAIKEATP